MVVDETAVGGDVHSDLMFVPAGSTADVVLTEGIISSENQNGLDAIHNYDVQSVADYLAANGYNAEISVYATGEQQAYKDAEGAYAATSQNVSEAYTAPAKGDGFDRSRSLRQRGDHGDQVGRRPLQGHRRPAVALRILRRARTRGRRHEPELARSAGHGKGTWEGGVDEASSAIYNPLTQLLSTILPGETAGRTGGGLWGFRFLALRSKSTSRKAHPSAN